MWQCLSNPSLILRGLILFKCSGIDYLCDACLENAQRKQESRDLRFTDCVRTRFRELDFFADSKYHLSPSLSALARCQRWRLALYCKPLLEPDLRRFRNISSRNGVHQELEERHCFLSSNNKRRRGRPELATGPAQALSEVPEFNRPSAPL